MECYLDNSATTKADPDVVSLMQKLMLEDYGNPSSLHRKGFEAERNTYGKQRLRCQAAQM